MADNPKSTIEVEKVEKPELQKHDSRTLDLAFAMDCTGSMGSYIRNAQDNIRRIVEEIVSSEKCDVRLALVEYRDHPPQDASFVTRTHDFTGSPNTMKGWLDDCQASGGGDTPEAVADALHDVLKLSWRDEATKICVCISDAPPHGLGCEGDGFSNGCPNGIDPMEVTHKLAEKGVTIYMVGCEPSIIPYKDFFLAIAYITGGQYVPLSKSKLLSKVIIGGAQEEMSLERLMAEVEQEVEAEVAAGREINEDTFSAMMQERWSSRGECVQQLQRNNEELLTAKSSPLAEQYSKFYKLSDVRKNFKPAGGARGRFRSFTALGSSSKSREGWGSWLVSSVGGWLGLGAKKSVPEEARADIDSTIMERDEPAPPPSTAGEEDYNTASGGVTYAQSSRMVKKAIARKGVK